MKQTNAVDEFGGIVMLTFLAGILFGLGGLGYNAIERRINRRIIPITEDLNSDGTPDCLVEDRKGFKTPWYGIMQEGKLVYLTEDEFRILHPETEVAYTGINQRFQKEYSEESKARKEEASRLEREAQQIRYRKK